MKGFTLTDAVVFSTVAGVAKLVSKIILGFLVDRDFVKLRPALLILSIGCAICLVTDMWLKSYWLVLVITAIYVSFNGSISSLVDVYTRELIGTECLASAFSWMELMNGILTFSGGFVPGI